MPDVPQPSPSRMVDPSGRPFVVGVVPGQAELVLRTAALWARAVGAPSLYCAYADPRRVADEEFPDGTVRHSGIDPDVDDDWRGVADALEARLAAVLGEVGVPWHFRYLAGRPDRALTHLARAVDASAFVIGAAAPGSGHRLRELLEGSVAGHLQHHQHRPVLVVPIRVVDWRERQWA